MPEHVDRVQAIAHLLPYGPDHRRAVVIQLVDLSSYVCQGYATLIAPAIEAAEALAR